MPIIGTNRHRPCPVVELTHLLLEGNHEASDGDNYNHYLNITYGDLTFYLPLPP